MGEVLFGKPAKQKSSSSSESGNHAYDYLSAALAPSVGGFGDSMSMMAAMLGLNNYSPGTPTAPAMPSPAAPAAPAKYNTNTGNMWKSILNKARNKMIEEQESQAPAINAPQLAPAPVYTPQNQQDALNAFSNSTGMNFLRDQGVKALEGSQAGKGMLNSGATGQALMQFGQNLGKTHVMSFMDKLLDHSRLGLGAANTLTGAGAWSKGTSSGSSTGAKPGLVPIAAQAAATYYGGGGG